MPRTPGATAFIPTAQQRSFVESAAMVGLAHDQIVLLLPMDEDRPPISTDTLVAHFGDELTKGKARAIAKLGGEVYRMAAGLDPDVKGKDRQAPLFFFLKCQGGWRETERTEVVFPGEEGDDEAALAKLEAVLDRGRRRQKAAGGKPTAH